MSATLDLAGGILIVPSDTEEAYYQITDSVGGGSLVMQAGSSLVFDDADGAGFDATPPQVRALVWDKVADTYESIVPQLYSVSINGTAAAPCLLRSSSAEALHRWALPTALVMTATRATFVGCTGEVGTLWTLNEVELVPAVKISPLASVLARHMPQRCLVERFAGYSTGGTERYDATRSVACRVDERRVVSDGGSGAVHTAAGSVVILPGDELVSDRDRLAVDGLGRSARPSSVRACYDHQGRRTHWEVSI